jgi:spore coat protein U-like protein
MKKKYFDKKLIKSAFLIGVISLSSNALAATQTSNFQVTATVAASCTITTTALAFPNYILPQLDGQSTITLTCTNGTPYEVTLDKGQGSGATTTQRKMTISGGTATLIYSLYTDSGRGTVWGASAGSGVPGTGSGAAQPITVWGRIPANQNSILGSYSDTIVATVTY